MRSSGHHTVVRQLFAAPATLQCGLGVLEAACIYGLIATPSNRRCTGSRPGVACIKVYRADQRLKRISEDRGALRATPDLDSPRPGAARRQLQAQRRLVQRVLFDEG